MKATLYDYQRVAADFIKVVPKSALFLDMGLGKTLITLTALSELGQAGQLSGHVLVIAPKRIAVNTWPDEIEKWDVSKGARYQVLSGLSKKKRDEIFESIPNEPPTIYIINRELVPQIVKAFPKDKWCFPNVVIDEAQSFKNYASVRFKNLKSVTPYIYRLIALTGTPAPNGLMDIWSQIYLLDNGVRLGPNITAYRSQFFRPGRLTPQGFPYEWILLDGSEDLIYNAIQDVAISMRKEDHLDMPDVVHNVIEVSMSSKERKIYNKLKKDKILPLIDGTTIESSNAAVLYSALLQLSNGAIYTDGNTSDIVELHQHKLDALEEIIDGANSEPILCFYWFNHDKIRLKNRFPDGEIFTGEPEQLKRWNNKEIPLLFAHPASAGHGLNFQHGGHILVFFCTPNSLELYEQSIARLHRNGQKQTVIVHYIKTENTIEDKLLATLMSKQLDQRALIDAVKAELE